ncbi:unnamed protein product [Calicophoron daubneyi]|uniref:Uncharacterized protein n=1 Tax=Calicophoron daubneyi TaxID=300641 RepID=A0AAV2TF95_CALDB
MGVGIRVVIIITTAIAFAFGVVALTISPAVTNANLTTFQKVFYAFEIMAVIFIMIALIITLITFGAYRRHRGLRITMIVLTLLALIFFIIAIALLYQFNPFASSHTLPDTAWVLGAIICAAASCLESAEYLTSH